MRRPNIKLLQFAFLWMIPIIANDGSTCNAQTEALKEPVDNAPAPSPATLIVGPRTPVNPFGAGHHMEVMAAADPESPDNLIVSGARANPRTGAAYEGYVYQSNDGVRTWREV